MLTHLSKSNRVYYLLLACFLLSFIQSNLGISGQQWNQETTLQYLNSHGIKPDNTNKYTINNLYQFIGESLDVFDRIAQLETDPEFLPYIEKYNTLKIQQTGQPINPHVKIVFSRSTLRNLDYQYFNTTAFCSKFTRIIFIDRSSWNYYSEIFREFLIFHELGHCDLNKDHTEDFTIMNNSYLFNRLFIPYLLLSPDHQMDSDEKAAIIMDNYQTRFNSNLYRTFETLKAELFSETNDPIYIVSLLVSLTLSLPYLEMGVFTFEQRLTTNNWIINQVLKKLELSEQEIQEQTELANIEYSDNIIYTLQQGRNSQNTQRIDEVIEIIREAQENK